MKKLLCLLFVISFFGIGNAQDEDSDVVIISHRVLPGQTVRLISVKYLVTPADIYRLNKSALDGISQGMVLQIRISKSKIDRYNAEVAADTSAGTSSSSTENENYLQHIVEQGETTSTIAEKFKITITQLKGANSQLLRRNPEADEKLNIPKK